ncbi:growth hormone-regulated TBC protein 1-A-like [Mya arenaria]|uniref:growth hormone-regulated TBC protein 1-A-like n=1 Tax=Mya arenaria TaxID=6604 RepID=UPI0022E59DB9|nr:growth hormone-regulated TBC protein 1-A-like [Mya arenaria]
MTDKLTKNDVDGYGFQREANFDHHQYDEFMSEYLPVMTRRAQRWDSLVGEGSKINKSRTVKRFCRKGIPSSLRPKAWLCLSGAAERMDGNPYLYQQMLAAEHSSELKETITMDIHRTFPDNMYFMSETDSRSLRKPLYNILVAIGHRNGTVGYCQGMNFIAGLLLLIMRDEDKREEKVFWLMDTLLNNILPDYYHPNMEAVKLDQEVLGDLVKWKCPELWQHLEDQGVHWCLVGMKWFICLFADVLPTDTVLRIWDCLFCEGTKVLLRAALVLVLTNKEKLLKCTNFGEITDLFKHLEESKQSLHCHTFLKSMFEDIGSLPMSRIAKLRQECLAKV